MMSAGRENSIRGRREGPDVGRIKLLFWGLTGIAKGLTGY
jgi:hypothetical protein